MASLKILRSTSRLLLIFATSILGCFPIFSSASPTQMKFQHILEDVDIITGEVRAIHQDSEGFMWIGGWRTLLRFDGYDFEEIKFINYDDGHAIPAPITNVTDIIEDSSGYVWITNSYGIFRFNPKIGRLERLPDNPDETIGPNGSFIHRITELPNKKLLAVMSNQKNGLLFIDPIELTYKGIPVNDANTHNPKQPTDSIPNCAYVTRSGKIWIGTSLGLELYDPMEGTFTLHKIRPDAHIWVKDIAEDKNGKLWLATYDGVYQFDPESTNHIRYQNESDNPNSLGSNDVWRITIDSKHRIWASTDQGGLNLFDEKTGNFITYRSIPGEATSLSSNVVRQVFEDKTGDLWLGLYPQGVDFFDQSSAAITSHKANPNNPKSLNHNSILAIEEDSFGNLWVGTDGGGLNFFDRKKGEFTHYVHNPDDANTIASNAVLSLLIDSQNTLWIGHWGGGVSSMNLETRKVTRLEHYSHDGSHAAPSNKINSPHVWRIYEDSSNTLWFATHSGGLNRYNRDTKLFHPYYPKAEDPTSISSDWVWSIYEDSKENFWVGTTSGINLFDREKGTFRVITPETSSLKGWVIYDITETSDGEVWLATNSGANLYNHETETFTHITREDGLFNDNIRSIISDKNGKLWLGTTGGASTYDRETQTVKNLNRDSGKLVGAFNFNASKVSNKGEVILGGVNGLWIYQPDELLGNSRVPPVVFTELQVNTDIIQPADASGILNTSINSAESLTLDYTKSMFVLKFSALNFRDSEKNQYRYMLDGFDENWINVGNQRSAKYTNLDPGVYTFRVQGSNNDGLWNIKGKSLTIIQLPPPWQTWWAYCLYVLFAVTIISWAILHQRNKRKFVEQQNKLLEQKVAERTAELRSKNKDIQEMLSNMQQGLFTIQQDGAIHHEYSQHLESIFATDKIANINFTELLLNNSNLGQDIMDRLTHSVSVMIGEDVSNYYFNIHQLITEYEITIAGKKKVLSLDWNPIIEESTISKLMVSVRDVTKLKKAESEAQAKSRELDIISQILNLPGNKFLSLINSVERLLEKANSQVNESSAVNSRLIDAIFRYVHTIKGNCRTFNLTLLSDIVHEVESVITEYRKNTQDDALLKTVSLTKFSEELIRIQDTLDEYNEIYQNIVKQVEVSSFQTSPDSESNEKSNVDMSLAFNEDSTGFLPLQVILAEELDSIPSIAKQVGKNAPNTDINTANIIFHPDVHDLLKNCFSHIIRNSLDHGIEDEETRLNKSKPAEGTISISSELYRDNMELIVHDDGQGLNIKKLCEIGQKQSLWEANTKPTLEQISSLIFSSGTSTKDQVSTISGRGVGMDAVKSFLEEEQGGIEIALPSGKLNYGGFNEFKLVITLPSQFYSLKNKI